MASSLKIEIKTESEAGVYDLLKHVFKEITEDNYKDSDVEFNSKPENNWLVINSNNVKGKYYWTKE